MLLLYQAAWYIIASKITSSRAAELAISHANTILDRNREKAEQWLFPCQQSALRDRVVELSPKRGTAPSDSPVIIGI
jgi:hypothetical protein